MLGAGHCQEKVDPAGESIEFDVGQVCDFYRLLGALVVAPA